MRLMFQLFRLTFSKEGALGGLGCFSTCWHGVNVRVRTDGSYQDVPERYKAMQDNILEA